MTTLRARLLTPVDPTRWKWLEDAVVSIEGSRLVEVGPWDGRPVDEDLRPGVLMPGFVDAHVHYPQIGIVGSASGPLLPWLRRSVMPEEARFADPDHSAASAEIFASALAASGTTLAMVYGSVHTSACDRLLTTLSRRGLRAIAGPVLMDSHSPPELTVPADVALPALAELVERWHGHDDGRLQVAVIPRFALSCTAQMMTRAATLAREHDLWVSTHLGETVEECRAASDRFGTADYLQIYEQAGLVHAKAVFAHCIHLTDNEWDRLAAASAVVAHCPDSNDFLGSGGMPLEPALTRGIAVAVGTDLAAGRSARVTRILASAYDNGLRHGHTLDPASLLWLGTRGGALALGQPSLGSLSPGLEADMVCLDPPAWAETAEQVVGWTLLCHDAPWPRRTWVRGQIVWDRIAWQARGGAWPWEGDPRSALVHAGTLGEEFTVGKDVPME